MYRLSLASLLKMCSKFVLANWICSAESLKVVGKWLMADRYFKLCDTHHSSYHGGVQLCCTYWLLVPIQINIGTFTTEGNNMVTTQYWHPYLCPVACVIVSHVLVIPLLVVIATAVANTPVTKISAKSTTHRNLGL